MDFETFWELFSPDTCFLNRFEAAKKAWDDTPADKQQAIITWLRQHGAYKKRNPYFFILDFRPQNAEPTNMNGRALKQGVQYVTAKYNGTWGTYSMEDVRTFGLETLPSRDPERPSAFGRSGLRRGWLLSRT